MVLGSWILIGSQAPDQTVILSIYADQTTILAQCMQHNQGESAVRHLTHINPSSIVHPIPICICISYYSILLTLLLL
jgi:hypothetical protein